MRTEETTARRRARYAGGVLLIAGAYVGMGKLGLSLTVARGSATPVWAPTGIALAALLLLGVRFWPGVFLGALITNAIQPAPVWTAAVIAIGNTLEAVAGTWLVRRGGFRTLGRTRDVFALAILGAGVSTTIAATIGVSVLTLAGAIHGNTYGSHWLVWWIGDAVGALLVTPLILAWGARDGQRYDAKRLTEGVVLLGAIFGVARFALFSDRLSYSYAIFPLMIWAALRFRQRGATTAALLATTVGIWATVAGSHTFGGRNGTESVEILQGLMSSIAFASLVLAATITERERAESAFHVESARVERSLSSLAQAQGLAHIGSWEWDIRADKLEWSDEMYRIYGLPLGSPVTFGSVSESLDPTARDKMSADLAAAYARGVDHDLPGLEYAIGTPSGERRIVQGRGRLLFENGKPHRLVGTIQDITGVRRAEEQFRSFFEFTPDAVVVVDRDGTIVAANPRIATMFGYKREKIVGMRVDDLLPEGVREMHAAHRARFAERPIARPMGAGLTLAARRADGTEFPVDISLSPLETEGATMYVAAVRDVTERKAAEDTLRLAYAHEREAAERLRAVDQMKDTFLTAVSHDLRTPLTALIGFATILRDSTITITEEDRTQILDRLVNNAEHLNQMLSDLLDLDRLGRGDVLPERVDIDLGELVARVIRNVAAEEHLIAIEVNGVRARADRSMLERIVENLVGNAVRYTPKGSHIWVRAERGPARTVLIVEDDGPGVADAERNTVFEPFRQGATANAHSPGVGIGLSLVGRFAAAHGGTAWVEPRSGGGASFHVALPD